MSLLALILSIYLIFVSQGFAQTQDPGAIKYLGVSYNGLYGNPEGRRPIGGVDPGLDLLHRIFELTYEEGVPKPNEVDYNFGVSCETVRTEEHFWGTLGYQEHRLKDHGRADPDANNLEGYEFTLSELYNWVNDNSNIGGNTYFDEKDVCDHGDATYKLGSFESENYYLNADFVTQTCNLPLVYDEQQYMLYLDTWGTDVVINVSLGQKSTTRYETGRVDVVHHAAEEYPNTVIYNGPYNGYDDSLRVDMTAYTTLATSGVGVSLGTLHTGDEELSVPIAIEVISIDEVLDSTFWGRFAEYDCALQELPDLLTLQINVLKALQVYAEYKNADTPSNPVVVTPITWPDGLYGVPETVFNPSCPSSPDFTYTTGWRYHDTADVAADNQWSDPYSLKGPVDDANMQQNFCMKLNDVVTTYDWKWMRGEYCIYREGGVCPAGFQTGYVYWDDEDFNNSNDLGGELPDGIYDEDTMIHYCCREDAPDAAHVIYLPTTDPFVLIKRTTLCPEVYGMTVSHQWFYWDCEDTGNESETNGFHPYEDGGSENHRLHYCVYN
ncbi:uncharacterized protein LOC100373720 [Saccoglossus kowalevskii]|uniref:Uncharacterized protein LOC100373720 n=1 Tax=Saccoglossus kowalevskii TaxID=10224 RepID=A0ABM0GRS9_SACKO|nr:PREDICTED: uncharacterized protein LOC100373720 [Saccoglossus kowalevskii]